MTEINRKLPAGNTTVQLLTLYTEPERHNAQCTVSQTNRRQYDASIQSHCARSAKKQER